MKNDLIKSVYDLEEKSESIGRRDFIKKAGIAGLALAGLGSLGGCAHVDKTNYDYRSFVLRYENNPIQINSIDDFALSGEELGWMRPCMGLEKQRIPRGSPNPLKGKKNEYPLEERKNDYPLCEEWLLAENVGRNSVPWYTIGIFARKFKSDKEFLEAKQKISETSFSEIEHLARSITYHPKSYAARNKSKISFNIFSKSPYIVEFASEEKKTNRTTEHAIRTKLYQKKRGLEFVMGNFDYEKISSYYVPLNKFEHTLQLLIRFCRHSF